MITADHKSNLPNCSSINPLRPNLLPWNTIKTPFITQKYQKTWRPTDTTSRPHDQFTKLQNNKSSKNWFMTLKHHKSLLILPKHHITQPATSLLTNQTSRSPRQGGARTQKTTSRSDNLHFQSYFHFLSLLNASFHSYFDGKTLTSRVISRLNRGATSHLPSSVFTFPGRLQN